MRDTYYEAALRFANRIRKEHGLPTLAKLRKGEQGRPWACPVAMSLQPLVAATWLRATCVCEDGSWPSPTVDHPVRVQRFVSRFDSGKYPELEA